MEFEEQYTPQFTNLIKQSLVDNVSLEDGELNIEDDDHFPQLPAAAPTTKTSVSDTNVLSIQQNEPRHPAQSPLNSFLDPQSSDKPNVESQLMS
eukprot:CAMPEP_0201578376 /NCGR_PEP_ID=MMETSP0190_2-20130828/25214_1 /ASSEMBLY_ACC=CAM_ASM_000263 /TAXON_ID=37353 /ORGANISM="Rosalina sp." /LENGTH=93 /DNA_ID=CAMNT_0048011481 /DNA_START=21 /DNA_END=298 /DNA_ORIENTATION=+